ncbi:MAG: deaminase [Patescibacteria group bacterium]
MDMRTPWGLPYLPAGREIFVVPADDIFMTEAVRVRNTKSTDKRHATGAVIVNSGVIIGRGANQAGFRHPKLIEFHQRGWCIRMFLKVKSGTKYWLCPGCSTHRDHAESGAVRDAVMKAGAEAVAGADLYLYGHYWCCKPCWDNMIRAGIKNIYVVEGADELFGRKK